ncbi:MAG: family transporter [Nevskia sp.]|nr:family transporter [Nevskia sp.]
MLNRLISRLEDFLFARRGAALAVLGIITVFMGWQASQLRMSAGFEKLLPSNHEYIKTFTQYRDQLYDANRLAIVVHPRKGDVWTPQSLKTLLDVTQAVTFLPGINRGSVISLWTPNVFLNQITEEGFKSDPLIPGTITPDALTPEVIGQIRDRVVEGGYLGQLVAKDSSGAMVVADVMDVDPRSGEPLDYIAFGHALEQQLRMKFEGKPGDANGADIQIIGFAKEIADIADGAAGVVFFCAIAMLLTILAVYWYCRSWRLTLQKIGCSLTSLVWQFGTLKLLGIGLDPLAVLVPFLVFAIGVSHGVQQINFMIREIAGGADTYTAARRSFRGLLIPGVLALATAFVSFITMTLVPIPMIRDLAITASIGVSFKIITNLVMLPLAASYSTFTPEWAQRCLARREQRSGWMSRIARLGEPRNAVIVCSLTLIVFVAAFAMSRGRVIGSLQPGSPELRADARYNRDALAIADKFDVGLDWITVVAENPPNSCSNPEVIKYLDQFDWEMSNVAGVVSVASVATLTKLYNAGLNEGIPKMAAVPRDGKTLDFDIAQMQEAKGIKSSDCGWLAINIYLSDHQATTIQRVVNAVKAFRTREPMAGVSLRLASGNAGVEAATDEVLAAQELPMMLYVYAAILLLVFAAYRDWRAMLACCLPLTVSTFIGYAFMKWLSIGLTVATLPVMVLAVGVGVDYAFYIYNRLQMHLALGENIVDAFEHALTETGVATVFTALTLSVGVATWSFSALKFQADMGKLLTFMFMVNMIMAITALPAFAVVLEKLFPRRGPVRMPGLSHD